MVEQPENTRRARSRIRCAVTMETGAPPAMRASVSLSRSYLSNRGKRSDNKRGKS